MTKGSIYDKIEQKGAIDAERIYLNGEKRAQSIEEEMLNSAKQEADQIINKCLERNRDKLKTKVTEIEQTARQKSLLKKKDIIDRVINQTNQKLKSLDNDDWQQLIVKLILSDELVGDEIIKVSKEEYGRFQSLFSSDKSTGSYVMLDKLNKRLNDNKYQLKLSKDFVDIDGGFIIIGKHFDIDYSYRQLLNKVRDLHESKLANILFEGGK